MEIFFHAHSIHLFLFFSKIFVVKHCSRQFHVLVHQNNIKCKIPIDLKENKVIQSTNVNAIPSSLEFLSVIFAKPFSNHKLIRLFS